MSKSSKIQSIFLLLTVLFIAVRSSQFNPLLLPSDLAQNNNNNNNDGYDDHLCPRVTEPAPDSCPVKCFRTDPVCGVDGVTYWCGCADAHCAGTRVAKLGFCEVGNGGSGSVSGQALLLVHIVWLILLGIFVLFGLLWIGWLFCGGSFLAISRLLLVWFLVERGYKFRDFFYVILLMNLLMYRCICV